MPYLKVWPASTFEDFECHEAAVGPAPDRHAVGVDVGFLLPYFGGFDLVVRFPFAEVFADDGACFAADEAGAASVDCDDDVAQVGGDVGLKVDVGIFG